ncbi:MAG: iron-containing alcohol dehydrogenase [Lachnospiraceae bacterium]|jgi:alcohol dehydrogenase YqhD (iron-dependent ADH family)|nr:iron-containing alcohol dehydrogenase [Lachnospiraceae bacterium]
MVNFQYYAPTKVVFGKDTELQTGALAKEFGANKVLVHYGGNSAVKSGLLERVCNSLKEANLPYVTLGGVVPNPRLSLVYKGIDLVKKEGVDFLLAVGGGSVIDSCKAIGYGVYNDCDPWLFYSKQAQAKGCLPVAAVLTIAAAGSEMSHSSVITNEDGWLKRGYSTDYARCKFAVMNPELTYTLPSYQTASGCVDIMMHTMERYFSHEPHTELTDRFCESLIRTVMHNAQILMEHPTDYHARAEVMWASSLSHNGLTGCGTVGDWASHQIEHELGGMFDVAHGAGLSAIWGSWARYVYQENIAKFVQFATHIMDIPDTYGTLQEIALAGICAMEDFYRSIHMPTSLSELGIHPTDAQIEELSEKCVFFGKRTVGTFKVLKAEDIQKIYQAAR